MGGLGIGVLATKNQALLARWGWRFLMEKDALWRQTIASKYSWNEKIGWPSMRGSWLFKGP